MTVTYTAEVATCTGFGCFLKLLLRWRGSIYKLVWPDLFAFLVLYYSLNLLYRYVLDPDQKKIFESISEYCETYSNLIPLSFVLGFYISLIMTRWWGQYTSIPWPDTCAVFVSSHIHGQDDRGRVMRRTIMRYVCLCLTVVLTNISPKVKKRFPTLEHFIDAGLLVENEKAIITDLNSKFPRHSKHWLPIVWAASIVTRARKEGRIRDDFAVKTIIDELNTFRGRCGLLLQYDSISVPLVYTQVVTLATYSFFITSVMGRQWLDVQEGSLKNHRNYIDLYFPLFTTLQFFFYMGWLKVAESLINPFGEDDDDFEVNWMVDRNLTVSYLIVDEMHHEHPELIRDQYWDEVFPTELPYTVASEQYREQVPVPSTANIAVSEAEAEYVAPSSLKIDGDLAAMGDDNTSGIHFTARRSNSRLSVRRMSGERQRAYSGGSQTSINTNLGSVPSSLQRVGSVTSVLKRLFSKDSTGATVDGTGPSREGSAGPGKLTGSESANSLQAKYIHAGGTVRIADQVIEEVDEQQTITSMAGKPPESRPTAQSLFATGPPPPSDPLPVPPGRITSTNLSSSAPVGRTAVSPTAQSPTHSSAATYTEVYCAQGLNDNSSGLGSGSIVGAGDNISIGSQTDSSEDEFTKLKKSRLRERMKYARSISAQQNIDDLDGENQMLLMDIGQSRMSIHAKSPRNSTYSDNPES